MDLSLFRESSPDPLTQSWNSTHAMRPSLSPSKPSASSSPQKPNQVLQQSSPNLPRSPSKQQKTLVFSTPSKTANKDNLASSPWRIKTIVQAEQEDEQLGNGQKRTTRITKVPLKGEDEHSPVKRRSSKVSTPLRPVVKSNTAETAGSIAKNERSSRKRKKSSKIHNGDNAVEEREDNLVGTVVAASPSSTRKTPVKRRKSASGICKSTDEAQLQSKDIFACTPLHKKPENAHLLLWKPDEVDCTPYGQERTATRKIRDRVPTPRKPAGYDESSLSPMPLTSPVAPQERSHNLSQSMGSPGPHDENMTDQEASSQIGDDFESIAGGMEDDTSVFDRSLAESEGFSMVSIESLKSRQQMPEAQSLPSAQNSDGLKDILTSKHVDLPTTSVEHVQPSLQLARKLTPLQHDSPNQNSPGNVAADVNNPFNGFGHGTKTLLSAELAIGELFARGERGFVANMGSDSATSIHGENLGPGNGSSHTKLPTPIDTQAPLSPCASPNPIPEENTSLNNIQLSASVEAANDSGNTESEIAYSQMSWRPTTPTRPISPPELSRTQEFERKWRKEREEVIRQAEQANSSQIMYINSEVEPLKGNVMDEQEEYDVEMTESGDIWQEEADRSLEESIPPQESNVSPGVGSEFKIQTSDIKELLGGDTQPLRSKLPRSWRRISGNHFLYSDEAESPVRPSFSAANSDLGHVLNGSGTGDPGISDKQGAPPKEPETPSQCDGGHPKGILSSPERRRRERSGSPKEVRFANAATPVQVENLDFADAQYFSSENSPDCSISYVDNNSAVCGEQLCSSSLENKITSEHETGDIRQLQQELKILSTPRGRVLVHTPKFDAFSADGESTGMRVLKPNPTKKYPKLFNETCQSSVQRTQRAKPDPILARHIKSSRTIKIVPAAGLNHSPPQGIFSRLSAWLYPPVPQPEPEYTYTYDWNRNHYLVLNQLWKISFQAPYYVQPVSITPTSKASKQHESLPKELEELISARITRFNGKDALVLTRSHCFVAAQFIVEARRLGIPLLCDGRRKVPKHIRKQSPDYDPTVDSSEDDSDEEKWPKRDTSGRVVRVRQEWTAEEVAKGVYGLWLIKTHEATVMRSKDRAATK